MPRVTGLSGLLVLLLVFVLLSGNAWSQDRRQSREREALRRVQQQMQQLRQEKAALEERVAGFEKEQAALAQEKEKLAGQIAGAQARARSESAQRQQLQLAFDASVQEKQALAQAKLGLETQKTELELHLAELAARQTVMERELAQTRAQKEQSESLVAARDRDLASCEDKNVKLYQHGRDLIAQCRDRSAGAALLRLEPFTGIKRVQIENLLEEYRDKLDAQKTIPAEPRK